MQSAGILLTREIILCWEGEGSGDAVNFSETEPQRFFTWLVREIILINVNMLFWIPPQKTI